MNLGYRVWNRLTSFHRDDEGMAVVEVILIIVVIIGLVLIFKSQLTSLINTIFDTISSRSGQV